MFRTAAVVVLLAVPALPQQPFELRSEGDTLTLSVGEEGMPMLDFVKLAQQLTGRVFTFSKEELAAAEPIELIGPQRMKRDAFLAFFQSRLYVAGFATVVRGEGDAEILEIVARPGTGTERGAEAEYVAAAELESRKTSPGTVLTSIPVAHVAPQDAVERLRSVLAATANDAVLGQVARSVLVQGTGPDVYSAWRMLRLLDVPPVMVSEVVRLRHTVAADLVGVLEALVAGRKPAVVLAAHEGANALLISGPRAVVAEAVEVVASLDRRVAK